CLHADRLGIDYVTLNPGATTRGMHESLVTYSGNTMPEVTTCSHEEVAAAMAESYYVATGQYRRPSTRARRSTKPGWWQPAFLQFEVEAANATGCGSPSVVREPDVLKLLIGVVIGWRHVVLYLGPVHHGPPPPEARDVVRIFENDLVDLVDELLALDRVEGSRLALE